MHTVCRDNAPLQIHFEPVFCLHAACLVMDDGTAHLRLAWRWVGDLKADVALWRAADFGKQTRLKSNPTRSAFRHLALWVTAG